MCPPIMRDEEREYYRQTWGFDPVTDARPSHKSYPDPAWEGVPTTPGHPHYMIPGDYRYLQGFPLDSDLELSNAGVRIRACVEVFGDQIHNAIIFYRRGKDDKHGRKAEVECTHTIVYSGSPKQALSFADDALLQEPHSSDIRDIIARSGSPVKLPPWEHFAALKSFVAGIAEVGLGNILRESFISSDEGINSSPFGFNGAMQAQVIRALHEVAPSATRALLRDFFLEIADHVSPEWLNNRFPLLDETYDFCSVFLTNFETFKIVEPKLDIQLWRDACVRCEKPSSAVRAFIRTKLDPIAVEVGAHISTQILLAWFTQHPKVCISLFPRDYSQNSRDAILMNTDCITLDESGPSGADPHVTTLTPREFEVRFINQDWIVNQIGPKVDYWGEGRMFRGENYWRECWRNTRIIFDVARHSSREEFERQIAGLDRWRNFGGTCFQDPQIFTRLDLMVGRPWLLLWAAISAELSPQVADLLVNSEHFMDLGVATLVRLKYCIPKKNIRLNKYIEYCGSCPVKEELIGLGNLQENLFPHYIFLPRDLPDWIKDRISSKVLYFEVQDQHVVYISQWKCGENPGTLFKVFPFLKSQDPK